MSALQAAHMAQPPYEIALLVWLMVIALLPAARNLTVAARTATAAGVAQPAVPVLDRSSAANAPDRTERRDDPPEWPL